MDVADFVAGVKTINTSMRVLDSDFKKNAAALGDWSKSATGMEERIKFLNNAIDLQRQKLDKTQAAYEAQVKLTGENSKAAQEWLIKVNKATESLNKMEYELGQNEEALKEMGDESQKSAKSVDDLGDKSKQTSNVLGALKGALMGVIGVVAAVAAGVAIAATAIGGLVFSTASASAELVDMAAKTGISTTRLQELAYVGDQVGTSQETITGSLSRLIRTMSGAQGQFADYAAAQAAAQAKGESFDGQLGDNAAAFERLGVQVTDSSGNLRDSETVFSEVITALGKISNETERDAISMSIFGKSAMELNPLIKAGSDELARLAEEAHKVGAVMSEEDVAAFEAFDDTLSSLQAGLKGTLGTLAASFLPGFQSVFDQAGGYLQSFSEIVRGSNGDLGQVAQGLTGLIGQIIGDVTQQAPQMLQAGLGILQSIITAIVDNLPTMIPAAIGMVQTLLTFIIANLPMIIDAGLQLLIALVTGIAEALPTLVPAMVGVIAQIVTTLINNLPALIQAALLLILALAEGLVAAVPVLAPAIPVIMTAIFDALIAISPMLLDAGLKLIETLAKGTLNNLPILVSSAIDVGKAVVDGVWRGIQNSASMFASNVSKFFTGIIDAAKEALGINSPSTEGKAIGKNFIDSVGLGGEQESGAMQRKIATILRTMTGVSAETAFAGAVAGGGGSSIQIGDIYVDARGAKDPAAVGHAVGDGLVARLRGSGVL
jgi:phage-related protein